MKSFLFLVACSLCATCCLFAEGNNESATVAVEQTEALSCSKCHRPSCGGCPRLACKDCYQVLKTNELISCKGKEACDCGCFGTQEDALACNCKGKDRIKKPS